MSPASSEKSAQKRLQILQTAQPIILGKGFTAVGLNEILTQAGVPKGSFYHYFGSKEQFGAELVTQYFEDYHARLDETLSADGRSVISRLIAYFDHWMCSQCSDTTQDKCLVVKLSAEVTDLSEAMRLALKAGTDGVVTRLTHCVQEGIDNGEIRSEKTAHDLAESLYHMWLGASLMTKVHRNTEALESSMRTTRSVLGLEADKGSHKH